MSSDNYESREGFEKPNAFKNAVANLVRRGLFHLAQGVVEETGVPMTLFLSRDRHKSVSEARRRLYLALREEGLSLPEIGNILDRDHTTILSGLRPVGSRKAGIAPSTLPPPQLKAVND